MKIKVKSYWKENLLGYFFILNLALAGILNQWIIDGFSFLFYKNLIWHLCGFIILIFLTMFIDYRKISFQLVWYVYVILILILFVLALFKKRWLHLGMFTLQPSEFVKPLLILLISIIASKEPHLHFKTQTLLKLLVIVGIPIILILPTDLDYAFVIGVMFVSFIIFIGVSKKMIALVGTFIFLSIFLITPKYWQMLKPYQKGRIYGYLNPEKYAKTWGYQLNQALIAMGSGGIYGHGLKKGWSTRLHYLPAKYTDLAFAVWGETWGFIGTNVILVLYGCLLWFCVRVSLTARDWLGKYISLGVALVLFWQIFFNISGCIGLLPMTSIPLPFLSYGGSFTISIYFLLSLVFNIALKRYFFKYF